MTTENKTLFNSVIAEIANGVCSLDNAIRANKNLLVIRTWIGDDGKPHYELKYPENRRFGMNYSTLLEFYGNPTKITGDYIIGNIFGETKLRIVDGAIEYDRKYYKGKDKQTRFASLWFESPTKLGNNNTNYYIKNGIEILGMKGKQTKDGKYKYEGKSIKELKEWCKQNGIKGFSGKDKYELVKMLMAI
jgi:hypothetical protein